LAQKAQSATIASHHQPREMIHGNHRSDTDNGCRMPEREPGTMSTVEALKRAAFACLFNTSDLQDHHKIQAIIQTRSTGRHMTISSIGASRGMSLAPATTKPGGSGAGFADALGKTGGAKGANVYQELEDYVKMTPAQRMRADMLKKMGLTEEDLAAKPPEEQQAIQAKLTEMIQEQMRQAQAKQESGAKQVGQWVDTVA
jgi:hypothetical protein